MCGVNRMGLLAGFAGSGGLTASCAFVLLPAASAAPTCQLATAACRPPLPLHFTCSAGAGRGECYAHASGRNDVQQLLWHRCVRWWQ